MNTYKALLLGLLVSAPITGQISAKETKKTAPALCHYSRVAVKLGIGVGLVYAILRYVKKDDHALNTIKDKFIDGVCAVAAYDIWKDLVKGEYTTASDVASGVVTPYLPCHGNNDCKEEEETATA